jgi:hypothetical protein
VLGWAVAAAEAAAVCFGLVAALSGLSFGFE